MQRRERGWLEFDIRGSQVKELANEPFFNPPRAAIEIDGLQKGTYAECTPGELTLKTLVVGYDPRT